MIAEKTHFAHISVAVPNVLDVPAAWEASQSERRRLEGQNSKRFEGSSTQSLIMEADTAGREVRCGALM